MTIAPPAPPSVSPPPAPSEGARTTIRVILVVAAAVIVLTGFGVVGTAAVGLSTFRVITDEQPLPPAMRTLTIDTADIPTAIRITAEKETGQPRVRLRMVNSTMAGEQHLAVTDDPGGARVTLAGAASDRLHWARGGEITVVLPPDLAKTLTVTTQQRTGMLSADADVERLVARTTNGVVLLDAAARTVEVQAENAHIQTRQPIRVSDSFSATTSHGDIDVAFTGTPPRTVEAVTRSGDIRITQPNPGPHDVRAQAKHTTVLAPETTAAGAPRVTARSENGDVTVDGGR